jgi:hypothetical protein
MKGTRNTLRWVAGVLMMVISPVLLTAQNPDPAREAARSLEIFEADYPRQKVFIHTDKQTYLAGETIWLKAYLLDAQTHQLSGFGSTLVVEMYNTDGEAVSSMLMKLENGTAHGSISLLDSLPEGNYLIRSYTNWMRNFGEESFFEKEILVRNPKEENFVNRRSIRRNRAFNRELENLTDRYQFAFFPEGGHLVAGVESRVAFKAANLAGAGLEAGGRLLDDIGREVLRFETTHNGMGQFAFKPREDASYMAEVRFPDGSVKTLPLPVAPAGHALQVNVAGNMLEFVVRSAGNLSALHTGQIYLVGHVRGSLVFHTGGTLEEGLFRHRIPPGDVPEGIFHITLLDHSGQPLARRLVFIQKGEPENPVRDLRVAPSRQVGYDHQMELSFDWPEHADGSYSLSVLGSAEPINSPGVDMVSSLLLISELPGPIERAWEYFDETNARRMEQLDLLMLTQGWSLFDWDGILAGEFPDIRYGVADGLAIRGKVDAISSRQPAGQVMVSLSVGQEGREQLTTRADAQGNFMFTGLHYTGRFTAEFIAGRDPSGRSLGISLETRPLPNIDYPFGPATMPRTILGRGDNWTRVSAPRTTLRSRQPQRASDRQPSIYGEPDQVIYMEDIREDYATIAAVMRGRVTGLTETPTGFMLRGPSSLRSSTEPLYVIDGTIAHPSNFLNLNPREVERIEVLRGPKAAIFGVRGANGVLIAITRLSLAGDKNVYQYTLYGYHEPQEFYHTRIQTEKVLDSGVYITQHWEPGILPDETGRTNLRIPLPRVMPYNLIILQGVDRNGRITHQEIPLRN